MIRRPPRYTRNCSSAASDVYKRQVLTENIVEEVAVVVVGLKTLLQGGPTLQQKNHMRPDTKPTPVFSRATIVKRRQACNLMWKLCKIISEKECLYSYRFLPTFLSKFSHLSLTFIIFSLSKFKDQI